MSFTVTPGMVRIEAPWTATQVESLNAYQTCGFMHPFTGTRKPDGAETGLIATPEGWLEALGGPVVQTWAWDWMADWRWQQSNSISLSLK